MKPVSRNHALDIIKVLALVTMIIDHARFIFPSLSALLVTIGRTSFPFFAICIAYNAHRLTEQHKVDSINNYFKCLLIFAVISEIPHMLLFWQEGVSIKTHNSIFTLLIGYTFIVLYEWETYQAKFKYAVMTTLSALLLFFEYRLEYGLPGVILVLTFYFMAKSDDIPQRIALLVASILVAIAMNLRYLDLTIALYGWINMYTVPFIIIIAFSITFAFCLMHVMKVEKAYVKTGKWMYWIYPVHMLMFAIIAMLMGYN